MLVKLLQMYVFAVLMLGITPSVVAAPVKFLVNFENTFIVDTTYSPPTPPTVPLLAPFQGSFFVDDAALAINGATDIVASLDFPFLSSLFGLSGLRQTTLTALVLIDNGAVSDIDISYFAEGRPCPWEPPYPEGCVFRDERSRFRALSGTWSGSKVVWYFGYTKPDEYYPSGTYSIIQSPIPEPSSYLLALAGMCILALAQRRRPLRTAVVRPVS